MRVRNKAVMIRLNEEEWIKLKSNIHSTGYKQEQYLRMLIGGHIPRAQPPIEYRELLRELHAIGNNMHQIAARANAYGVINSAAYQENVQKLQEQTLRIHMAVTQPDRI